MQDIFYGTIEGGKMELYSPAAFTIACQKLEGKQVAVSLERVTNSRSGQQNRWYWGVIVKMLSEETGHSPHEIHEILKLKFNPLNKTLVDKNTGEVSEFTIGHTTTGLDTIEFSDYCEKVRVWAAEFFNIEIPTPGEK